MEAPPPQLGLVLSPGRRHPLEHFQPDAHRGDEIGSLLEPGEIDAEMRKAILEPDRQHALESVGQEVGEFIGCNFSVRREFALNIGGFDEKVKLAEDHDYVQRAAKHGEFGVLTGVQIPVSMRRLEKEGLTKLAFKYLWCEMHALAGKPIYSTPFEYEFGTHGQAPASARRMIDIAQLREQLGRAAQATPRAQGELAFVREAVGNHLLLGGDNMDLALAHAAAQQFAARGTRLDAGQMLQLWHSCRRAKEILLADPKKPSEPLTVLGRGRKVIGGTLKGELSRPDVESVLVNGFFPECPRDAEPARQRSAGLLELGLPYAADPAVTRHLAAFLRRHEELLAAPAGPAVSAQAMNGVSSATLSVRW